MLIRIWIIAQLVNNFKYLYKIFIKLINKIYSKNSIPNSSPSSSISDCDDSSFPRI